MAVIVISYSRADQPQVRALVALLRSGLRNVEKAVYWDEQFEPGDPWFDQIKAHIDAAPQLFVFWCDHSSASAQVRREFTYAIERRKRVVPVLLDDTPLAAELAPIHGIDLRGAIRHGSPGLFGRLGSAASALLAVAALLLVLGATTFLTLRSNDAPPGGVHADGGSTGGPGGPSVSPTPGPPPPSVDPDPGLVPPPPPPPPPSGVSPDPEPVPAADAASSNAPRLAAVLVIAAVCAVVVTALVRGRRRRRAVLRQFERHLADEEPA